MKMQRGIGLLLLGVVLAGCDTVAPSSLPAGPSQIARPARTPAPPPQPAPPARPAELAIFTDPATGFATADVHDIDEQVLRFNTADEMIWVATDARFPEFIAEGNLIAYHHRGEWIFEVRFGSTDGGPRAYLTYPETVLNGRPPTILDVWVDEGGDLRVVDTGVAVP